ncbi:unnamed protein product [Effrenium voratum]|nr:unnamed protein product [Effrenium voratum]
MVAVSRLAIEVIANSLWKGARRSFKCATSDAAPSRVPLPGLYLGRLARRSLLQVARHGGDPTQGDYTEDLNRRTLAVGVVFLLINIYAFSPWVSSEVRNLKVCVFDKEYEREFLADAKRNTQGLSSLQDPDCLPLLQVVQRWLPS